MLIPQCGDLCSFQCDKDRSSTYDSLTSYYNRIGDRFHDISKWDEYQRKDSDENQHQHQQENENEEKIPLERGEDGNDILLKNASHLSFIHQEKHFKENSLLVQEISSSPSSMDQQQQQHLSTANRKHLHHHHHHHPSSDKSNGLLVTTNKSRHI